MHVTQDLVEAARAGDATAFEDIVRETHRAVYAVVYRIVGNPEDAADVTQEAYLRAWRSLRKFRGDAAFGTWLHRIAANTALTHLRRRPPSIPAEPEALEREGPVSADEAEAHADAEAIAAAMAALTVEQRAAVVLKDMYGWSCKEIADEMRTTEGAVKVRLFRARQRLADELARADVVVPIKRRRKGSR